MRSRAGARRLGDDARLGEGDPGFATDGAPKALTNDTPLVGDGSGRVKLQGGAGVGWASLGLGMVVMMIGEPGFLRYRMMIVMGGLINFEFWAV